MDNKHVQDENETVDGAQNTHELDDDNDYFNEFEHHVGTDLERTTSEDWKEQMKSFDGIRKSTEEFLKLKRDEFWDTHKDSIEDARMIDEAAEYHEQLKFMQQIEEEQRIQQQREQREQIEIEQQQQQLLAEQQTFRQQQSQPTPQQLQALLIQTEHSLQHLQLQYTQHIQLMQQNYQPIVVNITSQLNKAIQMNDTESIQRLQLQQQTLEQQFQSQIVMLQQQCTVQSQQLQSTQLNIKNALNNALQLQQNMENIHQIEIHNKDAPEFIPSIKLQENTAPHIVDNDDKDDLNNKQRATPRSISSQISTQSHSKSPATTVATTQYILSPSISPMKLSFHHPQLSTVSTTRSLPNSPVINVQSLAAISRVSLTPQFHKKRKQSSASNKMIKSLPNSPFIRSSRLKRKIKRKDILSPLILNDHEHNDNKFAFDDELQPPLPKIISSECMFDGAVTADTRGDEAQTLPEMSHSSISTPTNTGRKETDSSSSSSTVEYEDQEHNNGNDNDNDDEETFDSRKGSNHSLYTYSSMSTVFTGVHDGMLLANHSVYLSRMDQREEYNKMDVVNDIKSLWLQVFSIPLLFTMILTLLICWLSAYSDNTHEFGGFLLGIAIFNMIAHLMIKGMTASLSVICDELYNANCKPLIGIQLQKMMGFAFIVIIPMVMMTMLAVKYAMDYLYCYSLQIHKDTLQYMDEAINYCMFIIPPLTLFYVFQRYLQGSHVLHVNGYVSACLVGCIVIELGILIIFECVPSFKHQRNLYHIVLIAMVVAYWVLFVAFTATINIYKLHSETFIFKISWKHLFSVSKWMQYICRGLYRSALLFCMYWYFDFMIIIAGIQGLNELIAFGILCNIYHVICSIISASEFCAKSLIFRGLLHSSIEYARDSWKYTVFFGFFLSVIIGGVFFLLRENISSCCSSNHEIQSIMNDSWLYLYMLIICNGVKYGLVGGAQAMGYIKLVSCINLFSFYIVTIPVSVWLSILYGNDSIFLSGLRSIYLSILLGSIMNILCLLVFRVYINWDRELQLFTHRAHNEAQTLQESVEAVHIQLQHYNHKSKHRHNVHEAHCRLHEKASRRHHHKRKHHMHRYHTHNKHKSNSNSKHKMVLQSQTSAGSVNSFGRVNEMPLGRQRTNDTTCTTAPFSTSCTCNQCGEFEPKHHEHTYNRIRHDIRPLQQLPQTRIRIRRRRTIWEDLFDAIKQCCCCCLFDGCCKCCQCSDGCCEEWWYYCCGCCCSESYLRDDYDQYHIYNDNNNNNNNNYFNLPNKTGSSSTPYSNYHMDINNNAKYQIIHEDAYNGEQSRESSKNINGIKLEIDNDDLKHSLISHNSSMGGVGADYIKHSVSQYDSNGNTMKP